MSEKCFTHRKLCCSVSSLKLTVFVETSEVLFGNYEKKENFSVHHYTGKPENYESFDFYESSTTTSGKVDALKLHFRGL